MTTVTDRPKRIVRATGTVSGWVLIEVHEERMPQNWTTKLVELQGEELKAILAAVEGA
jgi:hypothetical protein